VGCGQWSVDCCCSGLYSAESTWLYQRNNERSDGMLSFKILTGVVAEKRRKSEVFQRKGGHH